MVLLDSRPWKEVASSASSSCVSAMLCCRSPMSSSPPVPCPPNAVQENSLQQHSRPPRLCHIRNEILESAHPPALLLPKILTPLASLATAMGTPKNIGVANSTYIYCRLLFEHFWAKSSMRFQDCGIQFPKPASPPDTATSAFSSPQPSSVANLPRR